jgi:hypothetical protein
MLAYDSDPRTLYLGVDVLDSYDSRVLVTGVYTFSQRVGINYLVSCFRLLDPLVCSRPIIDTESFLPRNYRTILPQAHDVDKIFGKLTANLHYYRCPSTWAGYS